MDYGTQFINNLDVNIEAAYNEYIKVYSTKERQDVIIKTPIVVAYKLCPGLIAYKKDLPSTYINEGFAVLDRNLKEGWDYNDEYSVTVNKNALSFDKIWNFNDARENITTYKKEFNNKFYVSSVVPNGRLYNPFILPLNLNLKTAKKIVPPNVYKEFHKRIESADDLVKLWTSVNSSLRVYLLTAGCNNFMLLGVYAKNSNATINPSGVINPTTVAEKEKRTNAINTLISAWNDWIDDYTEYDTFEQYLNAMLNNQYMPENIKSIVRESLKLCTDNIRYNTLEVTKQGIAQIFIDHAYYDIYGYSGSINASDYAIKGLCFVTNNKMFCQDKTTHKQVNESYVGNFNVLNLIPKKADSYKSSDIWRASKKVVYSRFSFIDLNEEYFYPVAIKTKQVIGNQISYYDHKRLYTYKKIELDNELDFSFYELEGESNVNGETYTDAYTDDELENDIENGFYITPNEYYSSDNVINELGSGDSGFAKVSDSNTDDVPVWFWSNTLMNWCTFKKYTTPHTIKLYVWNGKTGWDAFSNVLTNPKNYRYSTNSIKTLKKGISFSTIYSYDEMTIKYKAIILTYDNKFSQYTNDFQTLRLSKVYLRNHSNDFRFPFTIGIPPVMRLASGEIALLYELTLPGCDEEHSVIYPDQIKFINTICKSFFGQGDDKTIKDDWKRINKSIAKTDIPSPISSMNESSLVDADEINTVKDKASAVKMVFTPFKQYIETDNIDYEGYVERWN